MLMNPFLVGLWVGGHIRYPLDDKSRDFQIAIFEFKVNEAKKIIGRFLT